MIPPGSVNGRRAFPTQATAKLRKCMLEIEKKSECLRDRGRWALQEANTLRNSADSVQVAPTGAAKSAASGADSADAAPPVNSDPRALVGEPAGTLAAALAMIAELLLSLAEKAEAVRRLLAEQNTNGTP